jgi:hypothetical protein
MHRLTQQMVLRESLRASTDADIIIRYTKLLLEYKELLEPGSMLTDEDSMQLILNQNEAQAEKTEWDEELAETATLLLGQNDNPTGE